MFLMLLSSCAATSQEFIAGAAIGHGSNLRRLRVQWGNVGQTPFARWRRRMNAASELEAKIVSGRNAVVHSYLAGTRTS
jgi:hypothetical protein